MLSETSSAKGKHNQKKKVHWSDYDMKAAYFPEASSSRGVTQQRVWHHTQLDTTSTQHSILALSSEREYPCNPQHVVQFGRLAEQSPITLGVW